MVLVRWQPHPMSEAKGVSLCDLQVLSHRLFGQSGCSGHGDSRVPSDSCIPCSSMSVNRKIKQGHVPRRTCMRARPHLSGTETRLSSTAKRHRSPFLLHRRQGGDPEHLTFNNRHRSHLSQVSKTINEPMSGRYQFHTYAFEHLSLSFTLAFREFGIVIPAAVHTPTNQTSTGARYLCELSLPSSPVGTPFRLLISSRYHSHAVIGGELGPR